MSKGPGALVLLSGGLDSAVTALSARHLGYELEGLTFEYGQRHGLETRHALALARELGFRGHRLVELEPFAAGSSALTDRTLEVPRNRSDREIESGAIPVTYVPARNTIFLAHALAWCEQLGLRDLFIGVNGLDYSGYPDCRPEYLQAFQRLAALATREAVEQGRPVRIRAPLLHRTKAEIIRMGRDLCLDFKKTWSCYDPSPISSSRGATDYVACGACDSCLLRRRGFEEAGIPDPTPYAHTDRMTS